MHPSFTRVTVSVADLDVALELWSALFGLPVLLRQDGPDPELSALWDIPGDALRRQALLGMSQSGPGRLHLVEFQNPGPAVRDGAEVFDLLPKNLDIYVDDMPRRVAELKAAGLKFRNEDYSEVTAPDGTRFREIHLPAHDALNVVLLEVIGKDMEFTSRGFAGVGPLIAIVADATAERAFYRDVMGMDLLNDNILEGPEIEQMVGLPKGAALDVSIWGRAGESLGQMEIIDYRGVEGSDRFPLARPPSRGILHLSYPTSDLASFRELLEGRAIPYRDAGQRTILGDAGHFIRLQTPAGLVVEVFEPTP